MAMVSPHGSPKVLTPALLKGRDREEEINKAQSLAPVQISVKEACDLIMLGIGALSPLTGFMGRADWQGVLIDMKLQKMDPGTMWPLPITLALNQIDFDEGDEIALYSEDELMATMVVEEIYEPDKREECERCFM